GPGRPRRVFRKVSGLATRPTGHQEHPRPSQQTVRLGQSCREKQQIVGQETNSYHPPLVADLRCFSAPSARPSTPSRKDPSHCWPGQVSRAGLTSEFALPLCVTGRAEDPLVAWPTSVDLFICAKDLFVEAMIAQGPNCVAQQLEQISLGMNRRDSQALVNERVCPP